MPSPTTSPARSPHAAAPGTPPRLLTDARARRGRVRSPLPRMGELAIDTADDGRIIDLRRQADAPARLPRGRAGGRYRCCACGEPLIFTGPSTPASGFTPRFRHARHTPGADRCAAPATHQADVQADLTVVLALHDQLVRVLPRASVCLQIDPQLAGQRWEMPPALVVRRDDDIAVIERPRRLLAKPAVTRRLSGVRARYGDAAVHWWFFDRDDTLHFDHAGDVNVQPYSKPVSHTKVRPAPIQRQIAAAGAAVCWISNDTVFIPYGGHPHIHTPEPDEDWSGDIASWARDWRISHPLPGSGATWWGLIPLPLRALGTHRGFRPTSAFQIMNALERAQGGRERHRRRLARENAHQRAAQEHSEPTQLTLTIPAISPAPETNVGICEDTAPVVDDANAAAEPETAAAPQPPDSVVPPHSPYAPGPHEPALSPPVATRERRFTWRGLLPRRWRR
ncbi:hypothetical protein OG762_50255 (plasmid) [Streptomyces sp. NBC_01136]|uniref:hypothetical protein n=1 Tax=unclassified Streptomyces TaxID=2593676 RepID=UPI002F91B2A5|nr:hypothetical protein OG762_50255 [Streptomyces sp. NBC_01136]